MIVSICLHTGTWTQWHVNRVALGHVYGTWAQWHTYTTESGDKQTIMTMAHRHNGTQTPRQMATMSQWEMGLWTHFMDRWNGFTYRHSDFMKTQWYVCTMVHNLACSRNGTQPRKNTYSCVKGKVNFIQDIFFGFVLFFLLLWLSCSQKKKCQWQQHFENCKIRHNYEIDSTFYFNERNNHVHKWKS